MISKTQREALAVVQELCELSDDIRLGQLLAHLGFMGEIAFNRTLWDIEDDELLPVLYQHRAELKARSAGSSSGEPVPANVVAAAPSPSSGLSDRTNLQT